MTWNSNMNFYYLLSFSDTSAQIQEKGTCLRDTRFWPALVKTAKCLTVLLTSPEREFCEGRAK